LLPRIAIALLSLATPVSGQSPTLANLRTSTALPVKRLEVDWPHSAIEFSARFMGLSNVRGAFAEFGGTLMYDTVDVTRSTISVLIATSSINTNVAFRDQHLKSPDFFDAEKYPLITFRSSKVVRAADGFVISGPLFIHGITRTVSIPFKMLHPLRRDAWDNQRIGFQGSVTLKRSDFDIKGTAFWNSEFDPGRMSISDEITVDLLVSAKVSNVERWTNPVADSLIARFADRGAQAAMDAFLASASDTTVQARQRRRAVLENVGVKLMQRDRLDDAIVLYERAIPTLKQPAEFESALGEAYLMRGRREDAVKQFERAVASDSTVTSAREYLRHVRNESGKHGT
jgi:polyisoprenoid-binding protein YceI